MVKKTVSLHKMLISPSLEFLMEAHSGLSAKIVEDIGFKGIWAGSFALSASLGIKDTGKHDLSYMLEILDIMNRKTKVPILFDGSTGYGDYRSVEKLVTELEKRGIAGLCIEDKKLPKRNSLLKSVHHNLISQDKFCDKIKAAKSVRKDKNFVVIARTEAFIAQKGLKEALRRAYAYVKAGADGILVHSRRKDILEIESFMKKWDNSAPVVIIPTTYCPTDTKVFEEMGVSIVIWANHLIRASVYYMSKIAQEIHRAQSTVNVEKKISSLDSIFKIQGER